MIFRANIDPIRVLVRNSWTQQNLDAEFEEGYLIGVKSVPFRYLHFDVHLESGALFSGVPISEIYCERFNKITPEETDINLLQPYSCLQGNIQVFKYNHFKDYAVEVRSLGKAKYLFTIDYLGEGLSEDPEQIKSHNVLVLQNGALCAMPNNYILFKDKYFTVEKTIPKYKRNSQYITGPA